MQRSWRVSIPFLCPSELEQDDPFPLAGEVMWLRSRGMNYHPSNNDMDIIKAVLSNEMSYIKRSGHPNEDDVRLLLDLLDENIHARSVLNWQEQVSRRLKAVTWRFRVQEHFLHAALVLAQQGLIEPDFRAALAHPIDVSANEIHPSVHAIETALRRFEKSWRVLCTQIFPGEARFRRHLASPFPFPFSWLATVIARSATTTNLEPILEVLNRSQLLGPLETLCPPTYTTEDWQRFTETGRPVSPPGAPSRWYEGNPVKLVDVIFEPGTEFRVDPKAGCFPPTDPRSQGGRYRGAALNLWLPAGLGEGDNYVTEVRRYVADLRLRRQLLKLAFEVWFGDGKWGDDKNVEETLENFVESATEGLGADEDVGEYPFEEEDDIHASSPQIDSSDSESDGTEPFPPYPYEDWDSGVQHEEESDGEDSTTDEYYESEEERSFDEGYAESYDGGDEHESENEDREDDSDDDEEDGGVSVIGFVGNGAGTEAAYEGDDEDGKDEDGFSLCFLFRDMQ